MNCLKRIPILLMKKVKLWWSLHGGLIWLYGGLYSLLEDLVTRKMTVNSTNADQISFIINLMNGYNESKLIDIKAIKDEFFITLF